MLTKHKNLFIAIVALVVLMLLGRYVYKKDIRSGINNYKSEQALNNYNFEQALKEAAKIPDTNWDKKYKDIKIKDSYKVVLILTKGGEYTYGEYFKFAAERIGWKVRTYPRETMSHEQEILDFDPDFILFSEDSEPFIEMKLTAHRSKKYVFNFLSFQQMRNNNGLIDEKNPDLPKERLNRFISMAHGILATAPEIDIFQRMFKNMNKPFNGLRILPLVPATINEPAEHNNLMWCGMGWDNFRSSNEYKKFIKLLSENMPMKVYGSYKGFSYLPSHVYDGYIAPGMQNIEAIRKNGIYLLTHSNFHFESGVSSMRPFEAAAANAIIISDKHPFVINNFGDNVLYFDHEADVETRYKQVKAHVDWIKANPEKAKAMAARTHEIFLERFALEKDLTRIAKMHGYIVEEEKEMKLSYPLAY